MKCVACNEREADSLFGVLCGACYDDAIFQTDNRSERVSDAMSTEIDNLRYRVAELLRLNQSLQRQLVEAQNALANAEEEIGVLSAAALPQRFSEHCFDNQ